MTIRLSSSTTDYQDTQGSRRGRWALILGTTLLTAIGLSPTTSAQETHSAQGEKSIPLGLLEAPYHFDPATDTTFQTEEQEKTRLLKQYPLASARLSRVLLRVMDTQEELGKEKSLRLAQAAGGNVVEDRVTVIVQLADGGDPTDISKKIEAVGGVVVRARPDHIKAGIPTSALREIAETISGVQFIRLPEKPCLYNTTLSEGKGVMNVQPWHSAGFTGGGVKVAVIDLGFIGLNARQSEDEIPASAVSVDESGLGMESTTDHGCAVAEIIYDMAPNAQLYLLKIEDESDLQEAEVYCKSNGIRIVNHSMGWYGFNFFDGRAYSSMIPSPVSIVNDANSNGILWINGAGNDQESHALIKWRDGNGDRILDWTTSYGKVNPLIDPYKGSPIIEAGTRIKVMLLWNSWPTTAQDFDLYLVILKDSVWTRLICDGGDGFQTGSQPPVEACVASAPLSTNYGVVVVKKSATTSPYFILRSLNGFLYFKGYNTSDPAPGSIGCPADASGAWGVGAIDWSSYATGPIEWYSSLGPNNAAYTGGSALKKPDICGPDATAGVTSSNFYGTSASSPHLAGAAALVKCAYSSYNASQIRSFLEGRALDMGTVGKDNTYGWGRSVLGAPPSLGSLQLKSSTYTVGETGRSVRIVATRTEGSDGAASVSYATANGSATTGSDYTAKFDALTWSDGDANEKSFDIQILDDSSSESNETFTINLSGASGASLGDPNVATVTILDDDSTVTVTATDATAGEPATGQGGGTFTFNRSGYLAKALTVKFTVGGSATLGGDYSSLGTTVVFAAGSATTTKTVNVIDNNAVESNETVGVTLVGGAGYTVGSPSSATVTIQDDDSSVTVSATDATAGEPATGQGSGAFTFTRSGYLTSALTVKFTVSGTASNGGDYSSLGTTVVFAAGSAITTKTVTVIDNNAAESNETIVATLAGGAGYAIGSPSSATVTIQDDDSTVTVKATDATAGEPATGQGSGTFAFTRSGYLTSALTVKFTVSGTASNGDDYLSLGATVVFAAGSATTTKTVTVIDNNVVESNETVVAMLAGDTGYTVGSTSPVTVIIQDDDSTVTVSARDATAGEPATGQGSGAFTFSRSGYLASALTVKFTVSGTATNGGDYTSLGTTVVFAAGSATTTKTVTVIDNNVVESNETVGVMLADGTGYTVGSPSSATVTIQDDDSSVTVSATDATAGEPATGQGSGTFMFSRSGYLASALTVKFTVSGTATNGGDYTSLGTTVVFAAGSATTTKTVNVVDNNVAEDTETVVATLADGVGYTVDSAASATVTLMDDDSTVTVSATDATAGEPETGQGSGTLTFTRSGYLTSALTVKFTVGGSATLGGDYSSLGTTVVFAAGSATTTKTVNVIDNNAVESNETVGVTLVGGAGYTVGSPSSATVTIQDDDSSVTVSATDATAGEPATGQGSGAFTFTRSGYLTSALTVKFTVSGTASNGGDYSSLGTTVVFAAGSAITTKTVTVIDNNAAESNETIVATLAGGAGYAIGSPSSATVTIQDDDSTVTVKATDATAGEPATGQGSGTFAFTRSGYLTSALTVKFTVSGTASNGDDYLSLGATVVFAAGSATTTKTVTVIDNNVVESNETVVAMLAGDTGYTVGSTSPVTVIIQDDDSTVTVSARDATAGEPATGQGSGAFTFSRSGYLASALTVKFTVSGTATNGGDYTSLGTTVVFAAGSATATKTVNVINDNVAEDTETVGVTLAGGAGHTIGNPSSAALTIQDDDSSDIIVDNADRTGVEINGTWTVSKSPSGFWGTNYLHDGNTGKGNKWTTFRPNLPSAGNYEVSIRHVVRTGGATNVPVDIVYAGGSKTVWVNQRVNGSRWVALSTNAFAAGTNGWVKIGATGTSGYVIADAVRFKQEATLPDARAEIVESFDGTSLVNAWRPSDTNVYLLDPNNRERVKSEPNALKVTFDKANGTNHNGDASIDAEGNYNLRNFDYLSFWVYNTSATLRIKMGFEDATQKLWELSPSLKTATPAADWENLVVDLTRTFSDNSGVDWTRIRKIKFMVEPGSFTTSGVFWLDDIRLRRAPNSAPLDGFESDIFGWTSWGPFGVFWETNTCHNDGTTSALGQHSLRMTWGAKPADDYSGVEYIPTHDAASAPLGRIGNYPNFRLNNNGVLDLWVKSATEASMPLIVKFDDTNLAKFENTNLIMQTYNQTGQWQRLQWRYDGLAGATNVGRVYVLPYPGQADNGGTLYLDDMNLLGGTGAPAPIAPTGLTSTPESNGHYTVSWTAVPDATNYELQESIDSNFASYSDGYYPSGAYVNLYKDPETKSGTYYYRVRANIQADGVDHYGSLTRAIAVVVPPNAPLALSQRLGVSKDEVTPITLMAEDPEGKSLSYSNTSGPTHGALNMNEAPNVTYTPDAGYVGSDEFRFVANNGKLDSNEATITLNVTSNSVLPIVYQQKLNRYGAAMARYFTSAQANNTIVEFTHSFYGFGPFQEKDNDICREKNWPLTRGYGAYVNMNEATLRFLSLATAYKMNWLDHLAPAQRYARSWGAILTGLRTIRSMQTSGHVNQYVSNTFHRAYLTTTNRYDGRGDVDRTVAETVCDPNENKQSSDDNGLPFVNLLLLQGLANDPAVATTLVDRAAITNLCQQIRDAINLRRFLVKHGVVMEYTNGVASRPIWDRVSVEGPLILGAMLLQGQIGANKNYGIGTNEFYTTAPSLTNRPMVWTNRCDRTTITVGKPSYHSAIYGHGLRAIHGLPVTAAEFTTNVDFFVTSLKPVTEAHIAYAEYCGLRALGSQVMSQKLCDIPLSERNGVPVQFPGNEDHRWPDPSTNLAIATGPHAWFVPLQRWRYLTSSNIDAIFTWAGQYETNFFHLAGNPETQLGWEAAVPFQPEDTTHAWLASDGFWRYTDMGRPYEALNAGYSVLSIFDALNPDKPLSAYNIETNRWGYIAQYFDRKVKLPSNLFPL